MKNSFPASVVALLSTLVASVVGGFLLASWTFDGMGPATVVPPRPERIDARAAALSDSWREAGYEKIGLWAREREANATYASGSSRL